MTNVVCRVCGIQLEDETSGSVRTPCPSCGAMARTHSVSFTATVAVSSHLGYTALRNGEPFGFGESDNSDMARYASLESDGIVLKLRRGTPKNEEDSEAVCCTLIAALCSSGRDVVFVGKGDRDHDFIVSEDGARFGIQVVRAMTDQKFWARLSRSREETEQFSVKQAGRMLRSAIDLKTTKIPVVQRCDILLLIDASRTPALALGAVVREFRRAHARWLMALGFKDVFVVGPASEFVARLDLA